MTSIGPPGARSPIAQMPGKLLKGLCASSAGRLSVGNIAFFATMSTLFLFGKKIQAAHDIKQPFHIDG